MFSNLQRLKLNNEVCVQRPIENSPIHLYLASHSFQRGKHFNRSDANTMDCDDERIELREGEGCCGIYIKKTLYIYIYKR